MAKWRRARWTGLPAASGNACTPANRGLGWFMTSDRSSNLLAWLAAAALDALKCPKSEIGIFSYFVPRTIEPPRQTGGCHLGRDGALDKGYISRSMVSGRGRN